MKVFCIKNAGSFLFTKTVTSKASKSFVFVFFLLKIAILIQTECPRQDVPFAVGVRGFA